MGKARQMLKEGYKKSLARIGSKTLDAILRGSYRGKLGELHDGGGLYLRRNETRGGYWLYCYMIKGKKRKLGVGSLGPINATKARDEAHRLRALLRQGIDPMVEAKAEQSAEIASAGNGRVGTFEDEVQAYIAAMRGAKQHDRTIEGYERWNREHCRPVLGKLLIDHIESAHVVKALVPLMMESPTTGQRCGRFIKRVIAMARAHGRANQKLPNPADWELIGPALKHLLPKKGKGTKQHHKAMAFSDVPAFVAQLIEDDGAVAAGLLAAVLSGLRANEIYAARWPEAEHKDGMWRIPLEGMKAGVGDDDAYHLVPISSGIKAIFNRLRPHRSASGFIFEHRQRGKHIHQNSMYNLLVVVMGEDCTVAGFRSTISDWGLEVGGFSRDVMDAVLAHVVPGTRGSYQRTTFLAQRAKVMEAWSRYCFSKVPAKQRAHLKLAA